MGLSAGTRLGPYEIVSQLGAGGMGVVYRARDTRLGREVALKLVPPGLLDDEGARQRFRQEARALSTLNHANIATLYEFRSLIRLSGLMLVSWAGLMSKREDCRKRLPSFSARSNWRTTTVSLCQALDTPTRCQGIGPKRKKPWII